MKNLYWIYWNKILVNFVYYIIYDFNVRVDIRNFWPWGKASNINHHLKIQDWICKLTFINFINRDYVWLHENRWYHQRCTFLKDSIKIIFQDNRQNLEIPILSIFVKNCHYLCILTDFKVRSNLKLIHFGQIPNNVVKIRK